MPPPATLERTELGRSADRVVKVLRDRGPITRRQLEDATGYSRPTLSRALATLIDDGRVDQVDDPAGPVGRGRPSRLVRLNPSLADCIGLEVARGHVAVAIADGSGEIVATAERPVRSSDGLAARTRSAVGLAHDLAAEHGLDVDQLRQLVAGIPGPQIPGTPSSSRVRAARSVRDVLTDAFDTAVTLGNNTKLTAMAEAADHADETTGDLIFIRIDEGVGGGFVIDGTLATGRGAAGEFGHVCVQPRGTHCDCGGRGCLETVASLPALLAAAGLEDPDALISSTDVGVRKIIHRAAEATGQVIAGAAATLNPRVIVLGGRVATLPGFADRASQTLRRLAPDWAVADLDVEVAAEDRTAGARGAAAVAVGLTRP